MSAPSSLLDAVHALVRLSRLVESAAGDLSTADYRVLSVIASGEDSPSRLAARLLLGKPTVSATMESLDRRGLLVRSPVPDDARATSLTLSEEGDEQLRRADTRMTRQLELLCARAPDPEVVVDSLASLLPVLEAVVVERMARAARMPGPD